MRQAKRAGGTIGPTCSAEVLISRVRFLFSGRTFEEAQIDGLSGAARDYLVDRRWRILEVAAIGVVIRTIGISYLATGLALCLISLLMFRREVLLALFPFRSYLKQCLSIRGLENEPRLHAKFRRDLGKALLRLIPNRSPTACCCILTADTGYDGVLTVHSSAGQFQVRVNAGSPQKVTTALLEKVSQLNGQPVFQLNCKGLLPRCKDCSLRKAHRLVNRSYSTLIPRNRRLVAARCLGWLRTLTTRH